MDNKKPKGKAVGGFARASKMTKEERSQAAAKAAKARWNKHLPEATHYGTINLLEKDITCAVLEDERRVISHRSLALAMGVKGAGRYWQKKKEVEAAGGAMLPEYVSASYLDPYIDDATRAMLLEPISYRTKGGDEAQGFEATILPKICDIWIQADKKGALRRSSQLAVSEKAYTLLKGFGELGIIALVDEATGFQEVRDKKALQTILDKYLKDHARKWSKTFPDEFWDKLLKTKGYETYIGLKRPQFVGHWVNDIIYDRLAPGIKTKLRELNPKTTKGNRRHKHHQFLTADHGVPELKEHILKVITLMDATAYNKVEFHKLLKRVAPKLGDTIEMALDD